MREKVPLSYLFFREFLLVHLLMANGYGINVNTSEYSDYPEFAEFLNITNYNYPDYNYDANHSAASQPTTVGPPEKPDADILLPFRESSGSTQFPFGDDEYRRIELQRSFRFLGTSYDSVYINGNGIITFGAGSAAYQYSCRKTEATTPTISVLPAVPTISVYMEDSSSHPGGNLLYRQDTGGQALTDVSQVVLTGFPELSGRLNLTWMFLVTWEDIAPMGNAGSGDLRNTFQTALTTDGSSSFVVLIYKSITWPVSYRTAEAGIYGGASNSQNSYVIPGSCTHSLINITSLSNIGMPGKFVFRVDNGLQLPSQTPCVPETPLPSQIRLRPATTPTIGGEPVITQDLHLCPSYKVATVRCTFHDTSRKEPVTVEGFMLPGQSAAVCPKPEFYSLGRTRVDVSLTFTNGGQAVAMYGFVDVVKPNWKHGSFDLKVLVTKEGGGIFIDVSFTYTYRHSKIYSDALQHGMKVGNNATLTLMELRGGRWVELYVFKNISFREETYDVSEYDESEYDESLFHPYQSFSRWKGELPEHLESGLLSNKLETPPRAVLLSLSASLQDAPAFDIGHAADIVETTRQLGQLKVDGVEGVNIFDSKCQQWYDQEPTPPTDNLPCPPSRKQAMADDRFSRNTYVTFGSPLNPLNFFIYIQTIPSPSGAGSHCTYDSLENLMIGYPFGSRLDRSSPNNKKDPWSHYWVDVLPYLQCCQWSFRKNYNCANYFFVKRPSPTGVAYESPRPFRLAGTGHLTTLNGTTYQLSGTGIVSVLRYPQQLEVQAVVEQVTFNDSNSRVMNTTTGTKTAVMTSVGPNGTVTKLQVVARKRSELLVWMNDEPLNFYEDKELNHYRVVKEYDNMVHRDGAFISTEYEYKAQFVDSTGISLTFVLKSVGSDEALLEIFGSVSTDVMRRVTGLVGDVSNDTSALQLCVPQKDLLDGISVTTNGNSSGTCHIDFQLTDNCLNRTYECYRFNIVLNYSRMIVTPRRCEQPPSILNGGYWTTGNDTRMGTSIRPYCNAGRSLNVSSSLGESNFQISFTCLPDPHLLGESMNSNRGATWVSEESSQSLSNYTLECVSSWSRVKVSPAVVSILGSTPMTVAVIHALDTKEVVNKVTCSFSSVGQSSQFITDGEIVEVLKEMSKILCPVPVLRTLGKMRIRVKVDHQQKPSLYFEHHFWVQKIEQDVQKQLTILSDDNVIDLSWNASNFNVTNLKSESCELSVALMQRSGNILKEVDSLWYPVCNSGQYKVSKSNLKSFQKEEIQKVFTQPIIVVLKNTRKRDSEFGVASDLLSGIEMLHDNLVKAGESGNSFDLLCKQWYEHDKRHPLTEDMLPCPRSVKQAQVDWRFSPEKVLLNPGASSVFIQNTASISKSGSQCAYDETGALMYGSPGGSRVHRFSSNAWDRYWGHFTHDTLPYLYCCKWSENNVDTNCGKYFYSRRGMPVGGKLGSYNPPKFAHAYGLAHIQTFGGAKYRVSGEGDFWMIKYDNQKWHDLEQFKCQVKLGSTALSDGRKISMIKAVVMEQIVQGTKVTVQVTRSTTSSRGYQEYEVLVDNDLVEPEELKTLYHEGMTVFFEGNMKIVFQTGFSVMFSAAVSETGLNVIFSAGSELIRKVDGLLNGFVGERKDEFETRMQVLQNETITFSSYPTRSVLTHLSSSASLEIEVEPAPDALADPNRATFCENSTECLFDFKATGSEVFVRIGKDSCVFLQGLIQASVTTVLECAPPEDLRHDQLVVSSLVPGSKLSIFCNSNKKIDFTCQKIENSAKWISASGERYDVLVKSCLLYAEGLHQADSGTATSMVLITIIIILAISLAAVGYVYARRKFLSRSLDANPESVSVLYTSKSEAELQDVNESVKLINL